MTKNIGTELKRAFVRKYTWMYVIGIFALVLLANVAVIAFRSIYGANEGTYAYNLLEYATWCFVIPYYTCIFIADIGFGKEYPNPHIKDSTTNGLNRFQIYLSKLIVGLIMGAFFVACAIIALLLVTTIFQIKDGLVPLYSIKDFLRKTCIALPLWFAGVSFGTMFLFIFEKKRYAFISYFVLTLILPRIIMIFAAEPFKLAFFRVLRKYTITQNFSLIPYPADPARNVPLTIGLGIGYGIIAILIGYGVFARKKINK